MTVIDMHATMRLNAETLEEAVNSGLINVKEIDKLATKMSIVGSAMNPSNPCNDLVREHDGEPTSVEALIKAGWVFGGVAADHESDGDIRILWVRMPRDLVGVRGQ